jgi:hypothetical protein
MPIVTIGYLAVTERDFMRPDDFAWAPIDFAGIEYDRDGLLTDAMKAKAACPIGAAPRPALPPAPGAQDDLGPAAAELDAQAEVAYLVLVASEGDFAAAQALVQQGDELAHPGHRLGQIAGAMPVAATTGEETPTPSRTSPIGSQYLYRGGGHGQQGKSDRGGGSLRS